MVDFKQLYVNGTYKGTFIPCPVNRLLTVFSEVEHELYTKGTISWSEWELFVECSFKYLISIPIDYFQNKIQTLDRGNCDFLLRTLNRFSNLVEIDKLEPYCKALYSSLI